MLITGCDLHPSFQQIAIAVSLEQDDTRGNEPDSLRLARGTVTVPAALFSISV